MAERSVIGFDADDTLWHNERFFRLTQERFEALLADHADPAHLAERLLVAERRNLGHHGFGVKGFVLSMIETAIEVTDDRVPARVIRRIIDAGREMLSHPIDLLPHARAAVEAAAASRRVLLITKGDGLDQERKLARSGPGKLFDGDEIVSHKTPEVYARAVAAHGGPERAMMVGNSMKSDVLPALAAGAWGVFVPHGLTSDLEHAAPPEQEARIHKIGDLVALPDLIAQVEASDPALATSGAIRPAGPHISQA